MSQHESTQRKVEPTTRSRRVKDRRVGKTTARAMSGRAPNLAEREPLLPEREPLLREGTIPSYSVAPVAKS